MLGLQGVLTVIAIVISCVALAVSILGFRQAKKTALLSTRLEAINHVRTAIHDVTLHGNITTETVASIREAFQLSSLVFGSTISGVLHQAYGSAYRLHGKSFDERTAQDIDDKDLLTNNLDSVLQVMIGETTLGK